MDFAPGGPASLELPPGAAAVGGGDDLTTMLKRYLRSRAARSWLLARGPVTEVRSSDLTHAYATTCTANGAKELVANDLRVMHRIVDGFALGSAAAEFDHLLPYAKDPAAASWVRPMKYRRFAVDLKAEVCEYVEVGVMEGGVAIITVFVLEEGVEGGMVTNADVLYLENADALMGDGTDLVEKAILKVSLRGIGRMERVCRFCNVRGVRESCECASTMRRRCGLFRDWNIGGKGACIETWDRFVEKQKSLDRVATVTYTVHKYNQLASVNPFQLRLIYGRNNDNGRLASVFLQRATTYPSWVRPAATPLIENTTSTKRRRDSGKEKRSPEDVQDGPDEVVIEEISESECEISSISAGSEWKPDSSVSRHVQKDEGLNEQAAHECSERIRALEEKYGDGTYGDLLQMTDEQDKKRGYTCSICRTSFFSKSHLSRHRRSVHDRKPLLQCSHCDRQFRDEGQRAKHIAIVHEKKKRSQGASSSDFRCITCGFAFVRKYTLLRHIRLVHDKHRVTCAKCGRQFGQICDLKRHINRLHSGHGIRKASKETHPQAGPPFVAHPTMVPSMASIDIHTLCNQPTADATGMNSIFRFEQEGVSGTVA